MILGNRSRMAIRGAKLKNAASSCVLAMALAVVSLTTTPALAQDEGNPVVAKVDGTEIRLAELEAQYRSLPEQYRQAPMQMLYPQLLSLAVDNALLSATADASGIAEDENVQAVLESARLRVLREAYLNKLIVDGVTDEKVQARYDEMAADPEFSFEEVKARHILVEEEETAKAVIVEINGGADFAEVAQEKSTGPSGPQGGDLGYFRKGQMVPEFEEAAFALEAGSVTNEPVQTQFGWHVILVEEKRTVTPSLEETEGQIREDLSREIVTEQMVELRAAAAIERFDLEGNLIEDEPATTTE